MSAADLAPAPEVQTRPLRVALASWWGIAAFAALKLVVVWRLLDEEALLTRELPGYPAYRARVRFRLAPGVW